MNYHHFILGTEFPAMIRNGKRRTSEITHRIALGIATAITVLLMGCSTTPPSKETMDPTKHARIRVFNQNGSIVRFNPNRTCYAPETLLGIGDQAFDASNGGWSAMVENRVVGMPVASDTPKRFHEYVVEANQPMTIETRYRIGGGQFHSTSCGSLAGTFMPAPGADYESYLYFEGQYCKLAIRQLLKEGDVVRTEPVRYSRASKCS